MKKIFTLFFILICCTCSKTQQNAAIELSQNKNETNTGQEINETNNPKDSAQSQDWVLVVNDEYAQIARVSAIGDSPDGEIYTTLIVECSISSLNEGKKNSVLRFSYSIDNPDKISSFDFNYFEGPNAPALEKKLVEIQANSSQKNIFWRFATSGRLGGYAEVIAFVLTPSPYNKPDRTVEFAQMIAKGSTEVTITVHDSQDDKKLIKTIFPAIDPSSEVARILDGCGK